MDWERMESIIVDENLSLRYEKIDDNLRTSTLKSNSKPNDWSFQAIRHHENDNAHICYGTTIKNSSSNFLLQISNAHCNNHNLENPCAIEVDLIHSWDSHYVSNSTCSLYTIEKNVKSLLTVINVSHNECPVKESGRFESGSKQSKISVTHKRRIEGTFPCTHTIPLTIMSPYVLLTCTNLDNDKLTCISKVALTYVT